MSDQQLDDFLRKAAEQYDVPYNPHAWEQMNHRLDQADGRGGFWSRKIITGLILLLLLGGGLGVGYQGIYRPDAPSLSPLEAPVSSAQAVSEPTSPQENKVTQRIPDSPSPPQNRPNTRQVVEQERPSATFPLRSLSEVSPNAREAEEEPVQITDASSIGRVDRRPWVAFQNRLGAISFVLPTKRPALPSGQPLRETDVIPPKPSFARYGLSLGISPDISSVKLGQASGLGRKVSLQFEYFLFRKLSLVTGGILSYKTYAAPGEAYRPYPGYWKKYPLPDKINGQCRVLDIPLNLRYYAVSFDRSRLFISSGLSSYLMLREDYEYIYPYSSNYERHERNANRHYFKVANISIGYERAWGKRGALQIEPFVKLPLAGVGFGNIRLATIGTVFSLNYRLGR